METKENTDKPVVDETLSEKITAEVPDVAVEPTKEVVKTDVVETADSIDTDSDENTTNEAKPKTNKELIAYLADKFPKCFLIKGAAKPLKIGIFQELAEQLADDDMVSKTRLRQVLRHYTSSWRYLKSIKLGAQRINLQGEDVAEIDQEQADYASKTLKESQEKFGHKTTEKTSYKKSQDNKANKPYKGKSNDKHSDKESTKQNAKFSAVKSNKEPKKKVAVKLDKIDQATLKTGQSVKVQLGNSPMDAIVKEVAGNDVSVELTSGMVVKTQINNLFTESVSAKSE